MNIRTFSIAIGMAALVGFAAVQVDAQRGARAAAPPATPTGDGPDRDFNGIWMVRYTGYRETRDAPLTPWAQQVFKERQAQEDPGAKCLLPGVPRDMGSPYPVEFIITPKVVYILHEYQHMVRRIFIDGQHPADLDPSFMGHSIGHWEGNTLVVDTIGRNDRTWIAPTGIPHSDQIHIIERIHKTPDGKQLIDDAEIHDPKAYTRPWVMHHVYDPRPDVEIMEYICQENNRALTQ